MYRRLLADCFFDSLAEVDPVYAAQLSEAKPEYRHRLGEKFLVGCGTAAKSLKARRKQLHAQLHYQKRLAGQAPICGHAQMRMVAAGC